VKKMKLNLSKYSKQLEHFVTDNSPTILTAIGVVGVAGTAVLTWRATKDAEAELANKKAIRDAIYEKDGKEAPEFTKAEKFSFVWKLYVAPVVSGVFTCAAIVGANRISARRAAALAGVLAMTQDNFKEYRDKVEEKLAGPKLKKMKEDDAKEKTYKVVEQNPHFLVNEGDVLCIDSISMRPFSSNKNKIERAVNDMNRRILSQDAVCLTEWYDMLGLEATAISDSVGWNTNTLIEVDYVWSGTPDGRPAMLIKFEDDPVYRPWEAGSFR
jgi:hypothetical protein